MINIIPNPNISASDIKILRRICSLGMTEIKAASSKGEAVRVFNIFGNDWQNERLALVAVYEMYKSQIGCPFFVIDTNSSVQKKLSPDELHSKFIFWRSIELETQMNSDLENGYIKSPAEFEPHDEDWA